MITDKFTCVPLYYQDSTQQVRILPRRNKPAVARVPECGSGALIEDKGPLA